MVPKWANGRNGRNKKKLDNHVLALALYFMHYNFARTHKSLSNPYPKTPAMAAEISDYIWTVEEIVKLAEHD